MDTITSLKASLEARKGDWPSMCKATGLSYHWLTKVAQGKISEPGLRKVEVLQRYIAENPLPQPEGQGAADADRQVA